MRDTFGIHEASKILGIPPTTLRNWDSTLRPSRKKAGQHRRRRYGMGELVAAAIMNTFSKWGFSLEAIQQVGALVRDADPEELARVHILRGRLEPDGSVEFNLVDENHPEYQGLIDRGATVETNLRDHVLDTIKRAKEMGFDVLAGARKEALKVN